MWCWPYWCMYACLGTLFNYVQTPHFLQPHLANVKETKRSWKLNKTWQTARGESPSPGSSHQRTQQHEPLCYCTSEKPDTISWENHVNLFCQIFCQSSVSLGMPSTHKSTGRPHLYSDSSQATVALCLAWEWEREGNRNHGGINNGGWSELPAVPSVLSLAGVTQNTAKSHHVSEEVMVSSLAEGKGGPVWNNSRSHTPTSEKITNWSKFFLLLVRVVNKKFW